MLAVVCPHCRNEMYHEVEISLPKTIAIVTMEQIAEAKKTVISTIATMDISKDEKRDAIEWIELQETVFGPDEVETIINSIKNK